MVKYLETENYTFSILATEAFADPKITVSSNIFLFQVCYLRNFDSYRIEKLGRSHTQRKNAFNMFHIKDVYVSILLFRFITQILK